MKITSRTDKLLDRHNIRCLRRRLPFTTPLRMLDMCVVDRQAAFIGSFPFYIGIAVKFRVGKLVWRRLTPRDIVFIGTQQ